MSRHKRTPTEDLAAYHASIAIDLETGCWLWTGAITKGPHGNGGYGVCQADGKSTLCHRFGLELKLGRDLTDLEYSLHTCDNRACQNPDHLWAGSAQDNSDDMVARGRARNNSASKRPLMLTEVKAMAALRAKGNSWYSIARAFGRYQQTCKRNVLHFLVATAKKPAPTVIALEVASLVADAGRLRDALAA